MAGTNVFVEEIEADTLAELASAAETILNTNYSVLLVSPFPPTITVTRGQSKNYGGHVFLYGDPI